MLGEGHSVKRRLRDWVWALLAAHSAAGVCRSHPLGRSSRRLRGTGWMVFRVDAGRNRRTAVRGSRVLDRP